MQSAFHRKQLATFGALMTSAIGSMLERWQHAVTHHHLLDVAEEMMRLTLRIVGQALFNIDLSDETGIVGQAFTALMAPFMDYIYHPATTRFSNATQSSYSAVHSYARRSCAGYYY